MAQFLPFFVELGVGDPKQNNSDLHSDILIGILKQAHFCDPLGESVLVGADDESDINLFQREDENKNEAHSCAAPDPDAQIAQYPAGPDVSLM